MARRYIPGRLSVGLENEEAKDEAVETQDAGGANSLETELLEVQESAAEGESREAAVDDAVEVSEELQEDAEDVKVAAENGGLDQVSAQILARSVNGKLASIGISPVRFPATESFGGVSSRTGATQIALEGIKEKMKEIWQAIVNAFKKAAKWIRDHINKLFGAQEALQKRAKALSEKAGTMTGKAIKADAKKIENDRIFNALQINGNFNPEKISEVGDLVNKMLAGITTSNTTIEGIIGEFDNVDDDKMDQSVSALETKIEDAKVFPGDLTKAVSTPSVPEYKASGDAEDNIEYTESDELVGGKIICKNKGKKVYQNSIRLNPKLKKPKTYEGKKVDTLQAARCADLAETVEAIADSLVKGRKDLEKIPELKEKLVKAAERLSNMNFDFEDEPAGANGQPGKDAATRNADARNNATNLRKSLQAVEKLAGSFPLQFVQYTIGSCKSVLDYVELSLNNHE